MSDEYSEETRKLIKRARMLAIHAKTPWARKLLQRAGGIPRKPANAKTKTEEKE
jgi:hypothetical protein